MLDAFEKTPFAKGNDYVLAVWGDHGWYLGDNDVCECSNGRLGL